MDRLKFIALSGTTAVTENFYVYEYGGDMIVIDCGVGFPDPEMYGVDLVIPDFSYIKENSSKLRGIVVTHGHEDHFGALPFLLREVKAPIYASKLTAGFIKDKLADYNIKDFEINEVDPEKDTPLEFGVFKLTSFRVSHSVPDSIAFFIETPVGNILHVSDYKFDWTPVDNKPFNVNKAAYLSSKGVMCLMSDCLGSTSPGYTESERRIEDRIEDIVEKAVGRVFFTTISSNISRMQQAINVASRLNRKVCMVGRSVVAKSDIAKNLGYLHYPNDLMISPKEIGKFAKDRMLYIISGSYGQPGSALYRTAMDEHQFLKIEEGDTVIFSGDPAPPGSKANVDFVVDRLFELNVDVHYYDMQEDLHVSGHGSQQDIQMLFGIVKPKYFVPIGGTIRHMRAYRRLAVDMGAKESDVFELLSGDVIEFTQNGARLGKRVWVKNVLVDGLGIGDVGNVVLRDRRILSQDGIVVAIVQIDKAKEKLFVNPEIISRGFVFEKQTKNFLNDASKLLAKKLSLVRARDIRQIKNETVEILEQFFFRETGRRPMILPVVIDI